MDVLQILRALTTQQRIGFEGGEQNREAKRKEREHVLTFVSRFKKTDLSMNDILEDVDLSLNTYNHDYGDPRKVHDDVDDFIRKMGNYISAIAIESQRFEKMKFNEDNEEDDLDKIKPSKKLISSLSKFDLTLDEYTVNRALDVLCSYFRQILKKSMDDAFIRGDPPIVLPDNEKLFPKEENVQDLIERM